MLLGLIQELHVNAWREGIAESLNVRLNKRAAAETL